MKLQRYTLSAHEDFLRRELYVARREDQSGDYYRAADVDALLARIRVAVEAERWAVAGLCVLRDYPYVQANYLRQKWMEDYRRRTDEFMDAADALDALLADGGS